MARLSYVDLARRQLVMPIGTDLVLHEMPDPEARLLDGRALGEVVVASARRWNTPLAVPLMDLRVEKQALLVALDVPAEDIDQYHFSAAPDDGAREQVARRLAESNTPRITATCDAIRHVAHEARLLPMGMCIGPFSLMTKLLADPITPVFLAGEGATAEQDAEVAAVERTLALAELAIHHYVKAQIAAGAKTMIVCEPAANRAYISPNQMDAGSDIYDRYVIQPMRRLIDVLKHGGADLFLHDCGELTPAMVTRLGQLEPAVLSLGASRTLWEDAALLPKNVVLYGNLPSKQFYSDELTSTQSVRRAGEELLAKMAEADHPFILGTECDVLNVPGSERTIRSKVDAMMTCTCHTCQKLHA